MPRVDDLFLDGSGKAARLRHAAWQEVLPNELPGGRDMSGLRHMLLVSRHIFSFAVERGPVVTLSDGFGVNSANLVRLILGHEITNPLLGLAWADVLDQHGAISAVSEDQFRLAIFDYVAGDVSLPPDLDFEGIIESAAMKRSLWTIPHFQLYQHWEREPGGNWNKVLNNSTSSLVEWDGLSQDGDLGKHIRSVFGMRPTNPTTDAMKFYNGFVGDNFPHLIRVKYQPGEVIRRLPQAKIQTFSLVGRVLQGNITNDTPPRKYVLIAAVHLPDEPTGKDTVRLFMPAGEAPPNNALYMDDDILEIWLRSFSEPTYLYYWMEAALHNSPPAPVAAPPVDQPGLSHEASTASAIPPSSSMSASPLDQPEISATGAIPPSQSMSAPPLDQPGSSHEDPTAGAIPPSNSMSVPPMRPHIDQPGIPHGASAADAINPSRSNMTATLGHAADTEHEDGNSDTDIEPKEYQDGTLPDGDQEDSGGEGYVDVGVFVTGSAFTAINGSTAKSAVPLSAQVSSLRVGEGAIYAADGNEDTEMYDSNDSGEVCDETFHGYLSSTDYDNVGNGEEDMGYEENMGDEEGDFEDTYMSDEANVAEDNNQEESQLAETQLLEESNLAANHHEMFGGKVNIAAQNIQPGNVEKDIRHAEDHVQFDQHNEVVDSDNLSADENGSAWDKQFDAAVHGNSNLEEQVGTSQPIEVANDGISVENITNGELNPDAPEEETQLGAAEKSIPDSQENVKSDQPGEAVDNEIIVDDVQDGGDDVDPNLMISVEPTDEPADELDTDNVPSGQGNAPENSPPLSNQPDEIVVSAADGESNASMPPEHTSQNVAKEPEENIRDEYFSDLSYTPSPDPSAREVYIWGEPLVFDRDAFEMSLTAEEPAVSAFEKARLANAKVDGRKRLTKKEKATKAMKAELAKKKAAAHEAAQLAEGITRPLKKSLKRAYEGKDIRRKVMRGASGEAGSRGIPLTDDDVETYENGLLHKSEVITELTIDVRRANVSVPQSFGERFTVKYNSDIFFAQGGRNRGLDIISRLETQPTGRNRSYQFFVRPTPVAEDYFEPDGTRRRNEIRSRGGRSDGVPGGDPNRDYRRSPGTDNGSRGNTDEGGDSVMSDV
ncbi:hypothetical protein B0T24DRAFT_591263 [Lasiosphaeria ovina]|uniref:Uncharacterized protein n=1 Tax=Lasiosphaeria ovina TaxID=92902 RepID=A0AAE0KF68_9PEZI|nr:hypothetical protein B0T24DRAFT_591263 [Lasiosphaeria ovina]